MEVLFEGLAKTVLTMLPLYAAPPDAIWLVVAQVNHVMLYTPLGFQDG
jgi:hypothetical protein